MLRAFSALNFQQGRYPLDGKLKLTELSSGMKRIDLQHLMTQKYLNFPLPRLQTRRRYLLDLEVVCSWFYQKILRTTSRASGATVHIFFPQPPTLKAYFKNFTIFKLDLTAI